MDGGGHAEDKHNIEYVGADHISEGQAAFPLSGGGDGSYQLRQGSTDGNDCQADEGLAEPEGGGNPAGVIHNQISSDNNTGQAEKNVEQTGVHRKKFIPFLYFNWIADGGNDSHDKVGRHKNEKYQPLDSGQKIIPYEK